MAVSADDLTGLELEFRPTPSSASSFSGRASEDAGRCACCRTTCRSLPFAASACFALVAGGVALSFQVSKDVERALRQMGEGTEQARLAFDFLFIPFGISALVNWCALLQCFLASGRTRELLFSQLPEALRKEDTKKASCCRRCCRSCCRVQTCMSWYFVRPVQGLLYLTLAVQLLLSFVFIVATVVVSMLNGVCDAGGDAITHLQDLTKFMHVNGKDRASWSWASHLNVKEYCSVMGDTDSSCMLLLVSCLAVILGQAPMMACLSWSRERVRAQKNDTSEECVGFVTAEQLEKQAARLSELQRQAKAKESKAREILQMERKKSLDLEKANRDKENEMQEQIKDLRYSLSMKNNVGGEKDDEWDYFEEGEEEEQPENDGALEPLQDEFNLDVRDPYGIPPGRPIAVEADNHNFGCLWCSREKC